MAMKAGAMRFSIFSVQDHYPDGPRDQATLYAEVHEQCRLAEALGYDTYFSAEHHFHEYGIVPNPAVMLASLAPVTSRIRLGSAIAILTFHHPLTVAENYAMVDLLSGGRLVLGVGSGYLAHEFAGYQIAPEEKRERFDEALQVLERALRGERVRFSGRFVTVEDVALNILPLQTPPPIYVAILNAAAAYHVGRKGPKLICVPYASVGRFEEIAPIVSEYRRGQAEAGIAAGDDDILVTLHTHVAESAAEARRRAEKPFNLYVGTRLYARRQSYDDIMASGVSLIGSVDEVADKLAALHAMGVRHVVTLHNFGLMPMPEVAHSMRLLAETVSQKACRNGA